MLLRWWECYRAIATGLSFLAQKERVATWGLALSRAHTDAGAHLQHTGNHQSTFTTLKYSTTMVLGMFSQRKSHHVYSIYESDIALHAFVRELSSVASPLRLSQLDKTTRSHTTNSHPVPPPKLVLTSETPDYVDRLSSSWRNSARLDSCLPSTLRISATHTYKFAKIPKHQLKSMNVPWQSYEST